MATLFKCFFAELFNHVHTQLTTVPTVHDIDHNAHFVSKLQHYNTMLRRILSFGAMLLRDDISKLWKHVAMLEHVGKCGHRSILSMVQINKKHLTICHTKAIGF